MQKSKTEPERIWISLAFIFIIGVDKYGLYSLYSYTNREDQTLRLYLVMCYSIQIHLDIILYYIKKECFCLYGFMHSVPSSAEMDRIQVVVVVGVGVGVGVGGTSSCLGGVAMLIAKMMVAARMQRLAILVMVSSVELLEFKSFVI